MPARSRASASVVSPRWSRSSSRRWSARVSAAATPATSAPRSPSPRSPARSSVALIVDTPGLGWRWCFFIGLPVAAIAFAVLQKTLHLPVIKREVHIDYLGATLLVGGVSLLLVWVSLAGNQFDWISGTSGGLVAAGFARTRRRDLRRGEGRPRADHPAAPLQGPYDVARDRRLGADRCGDVRLDRLPLAVLPAGPRDVPDARRPDVDRDGRWPAGLEHHEWPDHQRDRSLEEVPGRRHDLRDRRV